MGSDPVVIIGGGLAGLSCAVTLKQSGTRAVIVEATDRVGGRVRTDRIDGFTLDQGFQVLLTAYPTCKRLLDYQALNLRRFEAGALIRTSGRFHTLADPWRRPTAILATATNPAGTLADKLRIALIRRKACRGSIDDLFHRPDIPTIDYLRQSRFSEPFIDRFFRPFIGGVFLDPTLSVSRRMFEFVFRMFAIGDAAVPADGMDQIPKQLAGRLDDDQIRLNTTATEIHDDSILLSNGGTLRPRAIVVATESDAAARLLDRPMNTDWQQTLNLYYDAPRLPGAPRMLMLGGDVQPGQTDDNDATIGTAVVISATAPNYAPADRSLVSVSVNISDRQSERSVDDDVLDPDRLDSIDRQLRGQLSDWFQTDAESWRRVAAYAIPFALPRRELDPVNLPLEIDRTDKSTIPTYVAGDHRRTPSIEGAMSSGVAVAEAILATQSD